MNTLFSHKKVLRFNPSQSPYSNSLSIYFWHDRNSFLLLQQEFGYTANVSHSQTQQLIAVILGEMSGEMSGGNVRGKCPGETSRRNVWGNVHEKCPREMSGRSIPRICPRKFGKCPEEMSWKIFGECPGRFPEEMSQWISCGMYCQEEMTKGNVSGDVEKMSGFQLIGNISRAGQEASAGILRKVDSRNLIPEGGAT